MTRRETPLDAAAILRSLAEHRVDYIVIGGMAVQAHGHTRTTQDIDVVPSPEPSNLDRLAAALSELGARLPAGEIGDLLAHERTLSLDTRAGGVDVHSAPPGAPPYQDLRARALELEVAGVRLRVAGLDDLIAMKRAAGRPIDRGDVIALTEPG